MRKLSLFATILVCCMLFHVTGSVGLAEKARTLTSPTQQVAPAKRIKTPVTIKRPRIRKAEIMDLVIGTHASGGWYWEVTVKNTGTSTINGKDLTVQGEKKSFPPVQNSWTAASGSIVSQTNIAPNQTVKVKRNWSRCCKTEELRVKLRDKTSNSVMDTKTLTHLLFDCVGKMPFNVKVKRVEWNDSTKKWRATLKNYSGYTGKLSVQGHLWPQGTTTPAPVGGATVTVPPNGEATTMWLSAPAAKHGDTLKVHKKFLMGSCGESNDDCGFKGSNNITLPNSTTFIP